MNTDNQSLDVGSLLAASDPAADITELDLARSRKRSLSFMVPDAQLVPRVHKASPSRALKRTRLWLGAGALAGVALLGGTAVLVTALAPTPPDRFLDAARIIPSLSEPQKDTDKIPTTVNPELFSGMPVQDASGRRGIDPTTTRRVGQSATLTYYAAPAGDDMICMIGVDTKTGTSDGAGCAMLKNFETWGMKTETADGTEAAWLMVPAAVKKYLESVSDESGWVQQSPNFLVRNPD